MPSSYSWALLALWVAVFITVLAAAGRGASVERRPWHRETELGRAGAPAAVILVPDEPEYRSLGQQLAAALAEKTGVQLEVKNAADYVANRPRAVKPDRLDRHFILLGQFWNNAVLERLYAGCFDPTDAFFPGPGGYELRTVCSPFQHGHNCVVATGSDLAGCRKAVAELPGLITSSVLPSVPAAGFLPARSAQFQPQASFQREALNSSRRLPSLPSLPFLHRVHLAGEAAEVEAQYRAAIAPYLANLERETVFDHPPASDRSDLLQWHDTRLGTAAPFGLRFWVTGNREDANAFKRLILAAQSRYEEVKATGRDYFMDYCGPEAVVAWDLVEESDVFTEEERRHITDTLYDLTCSCQDRYYVYHCRDLPLKDVVFFGRHAIAGTFWLWREAEYLRRNCNLTEEQRQFADYYQANGLHYLKRLEQTAIYSDQTCVMSDNYDMVMGWAAMVGSSDAVENGSLRWLADYWVTSDSNLGNLTLTGWLPGEAHLPLGANVLNRAGAVYPGEGYQWFRQHKMGRRWAYTNFLFAMGPATVTTYFNWEQPAAAEEPGKLQERMTGVCVLPLPEVFDDYQQRFPHGFGRTPEQRFLQDDVPPEQTFYRVVLREGFAPQDQYLVLHGVQGMGSAGFDQINAVLAYDDLESRLLKGGRAMNTLWSSAETNSLTVGNGVPGQPKSVKARLLTATDLGPYGLVRSQVDQQDGAAWTRHLFWRKGGWFLFADEVRPHHEGVYFLSQTWLMPHNSPVQIRGTEATTQVGGVTLHLLGTPERKFVPAKDGVNGRANTSQYELPVIQNEGVRQQVTTALTPDQPFTLWTLMYARSQDRPARWEMKPIAPQAMWIRRVGEKGTSESVLAFISTLEGAGLRITADMGLVSSHGMTLAGCREFSVNEKRLVSSSQGVTVGWDLARNQFEPGKSGAGLQPGAPVSGLAQNRAAAQRAIGELLAAAARRRSYRPPEAVRTEAEKAPPLPVAARRQLRIPVSLAAADLNGDGNDELLLYEEDGRPRFAYPDFNGPVVAVDFDGQGRPDVAIPQKNAVAIYRQDGTLRWRREITSGEPEVTPSAMVAGDYDGNGRMDLGVASHHRVLVWNGAGEALFDYRAWLGMQTALAMADLHGDGKPSLISWGGVGLTVFRAGGHRSVGMHGARVERTRLRLHDADGDGAVEVYVVGAGGVRPSSYDLRGEMRVRWNFTQAAVPPNDGAMGDVDGDGQPEVVFGGSDSFLYVLGCDGQFKFSRPMGAAITALATVPGPPGEGDRLAVGLYTGQVLLLGRDLRPLGRAEVGTEAVRHLAVLRRTQGGPAIIAADDTGQAVRVELEP